jgi:Tfp pilus assembly protein PilV
VKAAPGTSLVEVVVALTIFTVGLLGLAGVAALAQRSLRAAAALERGTDLAAEVLDSLVREPLPRAGARRLDADVAMSWTVDHEDSVVRIRAVVTAAAGVHAFTVSHGAVAR